MPRLLNHGDLQPLPTIAGGWKISPVVVGDEIFQIASAADPDRLLEAEAGSMTAPDGGLPCWSVLWPTAIRMANALGRREWTAGTTALEIGCGLGLLGIVALKRGLHVHLTDVESRAVQTARFNARLNDLNVHAQLLDWHKPPEGRYSLILASDVLYSADHHHALLHLVAHMLAENGRALFGDPGRTPTTAFLRLARQSGYHVAIWSETGERRREPVTAEFQLIELRPPAASGSGPSTEDR